ncbi:hypothetical protein ROJ8625_04059 [Roseivivax jejudonensis]|uniref:Bacterial SH3 domain protein n=1 Tax=Roseivivax jejudonensis TaxID=1529041 RepID=A0A1X7AAY1_9RHOB|nr:hypothetical protein [Roseivivax jejudonensis]SLN74442.1 hypothetical protein ROJ8625_04059 [Roseivivax jejudonensis]
MVRPTCLALILACATAGAAGAQGAAEPWEAGCLVRGLDPNGDGFLSVRTGPGSDYREIARVRNGDSLFLDTRECRGNWCISQGAVVNDRRTDLRGWFYTAWCEFYP